MYAWGTSTKGTIPVSEIIDEGKSGGGSSIIPGGGGTKFDIPRQIDVQKAFGIDDKKVTVKRVACGPSGTAAILSDGRCFVAGSNENGQLGTGDKVDVTVPKLLEASESSPLSKSGVATIRLGSNFSALIDDNGDLYSWGFGGSALSGMGCLGHGDAESHLRPKLVESLVEDGCYAADVAVGELHMTVLTTEGEVLTTGSGAYGRLGNLETADQLYLDPVELLGGEEVSQICSGHAFSLALTKDGIIHGWGRNDKGQLGLGHDTASVLVPTRLPLDGNVTWVSCGSEFTVAVLSTPASLHGQQIWTCGWNEHGNLGTLSSDNSEYSTEWHALAERLVQPPGTLEDDDYSEFPVSIAAGGSHFLAMRVQRENLKGF